jgi:hypothetical protein
MGLPAWPQPRSLTTREHDHLAASRTRSGAWRLDSRKRAAPAGGAKRETARIAADRSPERPLADPEPLHRVEAPTAVGAGDHLISATHRIIGGGSSIQDCASSLVTGLRSAERLRTRVDLDPPRRRRLARPPRPVEHRRVISRDGGVARPQRRSTAPMRQAWLCRLVGVLLKGIRSTPTEHLTEREVST